MPDKVAACNKCGAQIIFMRQKPTFKNPSPKNNPINRQPQPNGNLLVNFDTLTYQVIKKDDLEKRKRLVEAGAQVDPLYLSHFADCPFAQRFRKK